MFTTAIVDLKSSAAAWRLWMLLGWLEIRQRYARSIVGPFWLTISMAVMICSIGAVYGSLFGQNLKDYLPFLSIGLIMWQMFAAIVNDGALVYIASASYIRQINTPKLIFIFQVLWRNIIIVAHNAIIIVVLLLAFGVKDWSTMIMFVPGFIVLLLNATWVAMIVGLLSARFRDLPQIISALLQVAFYITPIMYRPETLKRYAWVVTANPMAYVLDLVREPLLGQTSTLNTWGINLGMAVVGWMLALAQTRRYLKRIPYWV